MITNVSFPRIPTTTTVGKDELPPKFVDGAVTTMDPNKFDEGWVDSGKIISLKDALRILEAQKVLNEFGMFP